MNMSQLALAYIVAFSGFPWLKADSAIEWLYLGASIIGGVVLLLQVLLSLFGVGHDVDTEVGSDGDVSHDGGAGGWLSFRAVVAFLTFFGLGGMVAVSQGTTGLISVIVAFGVGSMAFVLTRLALMQFDKLRSSGTVDVKNTVGVEGRVYLTIPTEKSGQGAVTVVVQGRTMQYRAITAGPELKTGSLCKVTAVQAGNTLLVDPI